MFPPVPKLGEIKKNMEKRICKWYNVCPMKKFYEEGKLNKKWIENYCFQNGKNCKRLEMVNREVACTDNVLPDGEIDESLK